MSNVYKYVIPLAGGAILLMLAATATQADTGGPVDAQLSQKISDLADAITVAEGSPSHINNPGDLTKSFGFKTVGTFNSEGVLMFANAADGQAALIQECTLICTGQSKVIFLTDTFAQMAVKYAGAAGAKNWAYNVVTELGTDQDTTIQDWLNQ